jgi:hypothetical protein
MGGLVAFMLPRGTVCLVTPPSALAPGALPEIEQRTDANLKHLPRWRRADLAPGRRKPSFRATHMPARLVPLD